MTDNELRKKIKETIGFIETKTAEVCWQLYDVHSRDLFVKWGFTSFAEYARTELEIQYRKAMSLRAVGEMVALCGIPKAVVNNMGWTKLNHLQKVATRGNIKELLTLTKKMNCAQVGDLVRGQHKNTKVSDMLKYSVTRRLRRPTNEQVFHGLMKTVPEFKRLSPETQLEIADETAQWITQTVDLEAETASISA